MYSVYDNKMEMVVHYKYIPGTCSYSKLQKYKLKSVNSLKQNYELALSFLVLIVTQLSLCFKHFNVHTLYWKVAPL